MGPFGHRVFTDSAPVLEAELAARSGQGWRGKHTLVLDREAGSMFFLGEIYVDMALPRQRAGHGALRQLQRLHRRLPDAGHPRRRTGSMRGAAFPTSPSSTRAPIPEELRPLMGNRIYGCDDCQLICPWNKFAQRSALPDFDERDGLTGRQLVELFAWTEEEFLRYTEGSPIRRIGHERWLRNVAVALGNALRARRTTRRCAPRCKPARAPERAGARACGLGAGEALRNGSRKGLLRVFPRGHFHASVRRRGRRRRASSCFSRDFPDTADPFLNLQCHNLRMCNLSR